MNDMFNFLPWRFFYFVLLKSYYIMKIGFFPITLIPDRQLLLMPDLESNYNGKTLHS